ncbi:MAG: hypothetical protein KIC80_09110 [Brachyspira sp.]|nr:hypothetical protein [Brachyspira sp.]
MAIQGFDYKGFAENLALQAKDLVPPDFDENQKAYVTNTLLNFSMLAGEALYNDNELGFNADQATMITQIIAEWAYHKSVDLVRSGIPQPYWDPIMQKIAFTIFEIAKQTFKQGLPQDQILQLIEHHVKKTYLESIAELKDKNLIDDNLMEKASKQSNIDAMMQQMQESGEVAAAAAAQEVAQQQAPPPAPVQTPPVPAAGQTGVPAVQEEAGVPAPPKKSPYAPPKLLKLVTLALLLKRVDEEKVQSILERFDQDVAGTVIKYMYVDGLEEQVDPTLTMKCLDDIAEEMPGATEINKNHLVEKVKQIAELYDKAKLEQMLQLERQKVRRFVFNALEGEYYDIPPRVANVIATHLQHGV